MLSLSGSRSSAAGTLAWKGSSFFVAVADGAACATAIKAASKPAAAAVNAAGPVFGCLLRKLVAKARPRCARTSKDSHRPNLGAQWGVRKATTPHRHSRDNAQRATARSGSVEPAAVEVLGGTIKAAAQRDPSHDGRKLRLSRGDTPGPQILRWRRNRRQRSGADV